MTTRLRLLSAATIAAAAGSLCAAGVASADPAPPSTYTDAATGRCLDSNSGGSVYALQCNGGGFQEWGNVSGNYLRDQATGRCLDSNPGGSVYTLPCNGGGFQNWIPTKVLSRNGAQLTATFVDQATGRCLDSNSGGSVYTQPCNGGDFQYWRMYVD